MNATQAGISAAKLRHEAAYHERRARQSTGKLAEFYNERANAYNATAEALEKILGIDRQPADPTAGFFRDSRNG